MKKNNNEGFVLAETFVVSTFVLATLVFLYIQFQNINRSYNISFSYNTVNDLYITNELKKFIKSDNYNNINSILENSSAGFLVLTDENEFSANFIDPDMWEFILEKGNVKTVLYASESMPQLKQNGGSSLTSEKMKDFIKTVKVDDDSGVYRLIVEFNDDTYASLKVS